MTRARVSLALAAAVIVTAAALFVSRSPDPGLDLATRPQTIFATIPLEVGASYSLGSLRIPDDVPRPVRVASVSVIAKSGVIEAGVVAGTHPDTGIGLIPEWPPSGGYVDPFAPGTTFSGPVEIVIGLTTSAGRSGLRGVDVHWVDATGAEGRHVFDIATATCAPAACTIPDDIDGFLRELGLEK